MLAHPLARQGLGLAPRSPRPWHPRAYNRDVEPIQPATWPCPGRDLLQSCLSGHVQAPGLRHFMKRPQDTGQFWGPAVAQEDDKGDSPTHCPSPLNPHPGSPWEWASGI